MYEIFMLDITFLPTPGHAGDTWNDSGLGVFCLGGGGRQKAANLRFSWQNGNRLFEE